MRKVGRGRSSQEDLRMRVIPIVLVLGSLGCASGASSQTPPPSSAVAPGAWIGADSARFVFSREPHLQLAWDQRDSTAYVDRPEYAWQVYWEPEARGHVPHALWLVTYWRAGGPRSGSLSEMLRRWPVLTMTECLECDGASIGKEDQGVRAVVVADHVEFIVRGAAAMKRIFPIHPDSVQLIRQLGAGAEDEELTVPVQTWSGD